MKFKTLSTIAAIGLTAGFANAAMAEECGSLTMAEMDWASAEFMANVDKIVLEAGYGCEVELIPGATTTTFASMNEKGQPDVAGELWINAVRDPLAAAMAEGRLHSVNGGPIDGLGEGWWVDPKFAADHPEITTVEQLLEHPEFFPYAEDESLGAFMGCPAGWGCQLSNASLFRAFDMEEKGWTLVDPGSAALGRYPMVAVDMGPYDAEIHACNQTVDCATPAKSSYPAAPVLTVVTSDFAERNPEVFDLVSKISFTSLELSQLLAWQADNGASSEEAAVYYLMGNKDNVMSWVSEDAAAKLSAILK